MFFIVMYNKFGSVFYLTENPLTGFCMFVPDMGDDNLDVLGFESLPLAKTMLRPLFHDYKSREEPFELRIMNVETSECVVSLIWSGKK